MDLRNPGRTLRAIAVLTLLLNVTWTNAQCQQNFVRVHNKCYYFSKDKVSWRDAYWRCEEMDSTLLTLKHKGADKKFNRYLNQRYIQPSEWWMGASYDWKQKLWKWAPSGETLKYSRFANNDHNQDLQWNCAILDPTISYKWWNSRKCTDTKKYICQTGLSPTAAPTSEDLPHIAPPGSAYRNDQQLKPKDGQPAYTHRPIRNKPRDLSKPRIVCPRKYKHVRGMCYKFSTEKASWNTAYFNCDEEYNGTLAIIRDRREDKALRRAFKRLSIDTEDRWIGGKFDWKYMAWKWASDGTIIQHQNYGVESLKWHCLVWAPLLKDKWTSELCTTEKYYICQTKPTKVVARKRVPMAMPKKRVQYHKS